VKEGVFGSDINFVPYSLELLVDGDLANTFGNLVRRAITLSHKSFGGKVPKYDAEPFFDNISELLSKSFTEMENFSLQGTVNIALEYLRLANKWITEKAPWNLTEEFATEKGVYVRTILEAVFILTHFLYPYIPESCEVVFKCYQKNH